MLSNAYFVVKFHFDTAENEPAKNLQNFANFAYHAASAGWSLLGGRRTPRRPPKLNVSLFHYRNHGSDVGRVLVGVQVRAVGDWGLAKLTNFATWCCKFLAGSFSAVSKRNFARKYAFDSIFQALQDLHTFAPLQSQKFRKKSVSKISNFWENSAKFCKSLCRKTCKNFPILSNFIQFSKIAAR